jgi:hypothetical protein
MSDLTDGRFDRDDEFYLGLTFIDCLRAASDGDHERMALSIGELAAWGISIEIAGSDKH